MVLLLLLTLFVLHDVIIIDSEEVFNYYFEPARIMVTRGGVEDDNIKESYVEKLDSIYYNYNLENYDKATIGFEEYFEKYGYTNDYDLYYAGMSALFSNNPDKALNFFTKIDKDSLLYEDVEWCIVGCYLLKNNIYLARNLLKKIANEPRNYYKDSAEKILKIKIRNR